MPIESVMPSTHVILCRPLLLLHPIPPASGSSQWVNSSHEVTKVLEFQLYHQSFQWTPRTDFLWDGLTGSPCSPRDSQESFLTPQFKSINSSVLSFLHSPAITSIHDHCKNLALTRWTFVGKVMSLLFNMLSRLVITFLQRSKCLLISWLAITICSDFGAPKYKVSHYFHGFPIYVSAIQQGNSTVIIHFSLLSWAFLPTPQPTPLGHYRTQGWAPCVKKQILTSKTESLRKVY